MKISFFHTERADWGFIIPATLIWIFALLVTAYDFVQFQGMIYRFGIVNAVGLCVSLIGVSIRKLAKRTLGKYFSSGLKISKEHKLIKHGMYKHIRHPAYLGVLLFWIGFSLFLGSLYGFFLMFGLIPCYLYRIRIEERMLMDKFGDEYREYMKNTKKIIPYVY